MSHEDAELIAASLAGRTDAFGRLVTKYQDRLYASMVHVTGSAEEAQDVVQEAFIQAFLKLDGYQHTAAFFTWLYRIAFNQSVSRRRRKKPSVSVETARQEQGWEPLDRNEAPSDQMERDERAAQVQAALAALGEEHRAILVLREIDGCDYQQIADILEVAVGTVRSRLHRARLQLREQLKPVWQADQT